ncbi:MAG: hypothetical protein JWR80_2500, partial [Bradyrhizobium sp.]|nr:hypothetical protein [Bradyrhizobium sp.]
LRSCLQPQNVTIPVFFVGSDGFAAVTAQIRAIPTLPFPWSPVKGKHWSNAAWLV